MTATQNKRGLDVDQLILDLHQKGFTNADIKQTAHVGGKRIKEVLQGTHVPKKAGRPKKYTEDIEIFIESQFLQDARVTDQTIAQRVEQEFGVQISRQRVCEIRNQYHIRYRPPITVQLLTDEQKGQRIQFCSEMKEQLTATPNMVIVFSDESRFAKGPDNSWVRYRSGQWNETATKKKEKFPLSAMFWGAVGIGYKSPLMICSGSVKASEYQTIMTQSGIFKDCDRSHGRFGWYFMQDGAPCHTSEDTVAWLQRQCLVLPGWPPNSPDLNPIEMIWAIIKARLYKRIDIKTRDELIAAVQAAWDAIAQETIDSLVRSFGRRVTLALEMMGGSISGILSSHMEHPKPQMIVEYDYERWSEAEDQTLLQLHARYGNAWTKIARAMPGRWSNEVKNRTKMLQMRNRNRLSLSRPIFPPIHALGIPLDEPDWRPIAIGDFIDFFAR